MVLRKLANLFRTADSREHDVREPRVVTVATVGSEAEASILAGSLRAAGISCATKKFGDMIASDMTSGGGVGSFGYSYDVQVRVQDEKEARRTLKT